MKRFWPFIALVMLAGCSAGSLVERNYYVLEYANHTEDANLVQAEPIDAVVVVNDTNVPATYNKSRIVIRHFGPRITYADNDNWALKLSDAVPRLVTMRFNRYGVFRQTSRNFSQETPPYEISTTVYNIELYQSDMLNQAHLKMEFTLNKVIDGSVVVQHSFDREENLLSLDMDTFVQKIDEMILQETDNFIRKVVYHFKGGEMPGAQPVLAQAGADTLLQEAEDEESAGNEMGLLLLPSLSFSENEPAYTIIDKYGLETSGRMGEPIPLLEGFYSVRFGSGDVKQQMEQNNIEIVAGYKRIVEPTWGCLIVDMTDESRDFADVSYEIFRLDNAESFGSEFPVDVSLGEQEKVWVLPPGYYKVTINNEPFNTYKDFTTVYVEEGKMQTLTIVVDLDEDGNPTNMIGAGILRESDANARQNAVKVSSAIHANATLNSDNTADKNNPATTVTVTTQFDTKVVWDDYPYHFTSKNLIELGSTKDEDTGFRITANDFSLKNTFIYYIIRSFGFYVRGNMSASLLEDHRYSSDAQNYRLIDSDGVVTEYPDDKNVKVSPYFLPMGFKEGVGVNWRVVNTPRVNLYARMGFGMQQDLNNGVYTYTETKMDSTGAEWLEYNEVDSDSKEGLEFSIESDFRLPLNIRLNSNIDALKPFGSNTNMSAEWENIFNLRLIKQLSIDYKLLITYDKDVVDYVVWNHSLFLRFSYFLY